MSDIIKFLDKWMKDNGTISFEDSDKLAKFMSDIGAEIDKLSVEPPQDSNKLILYAGRNGEVPMWKVAEGASLSGQGYYYISSTQAGSILNNPNFRNKVNEICNGNKDLYARVFGNPVDGVRQSYFGGQLALNDRVSFRLAGQAAGDVTIWAPNGEVNTVLTETELRAVLTNEKVTSINGVSKDIFIDSYKKYANVADFPMDNPQNLDTNALYSVLEEIKETKEVTYFDKAVVYYNNGGEVIAVDTSPFLGGNKNLPESTEVVFKTTIGDTRQYTSIENIKNICPEYENLSDITKMQVRQLEFDLRNENIDKLPNWLNANSSDNIGNVRVSMDANGKVVGIDVSSITGGVPNDIPKDAVFSTTIAQISNYSSEAHLSSICPEYNNMTSLQKMQLGQFELCARNFDLEGMRASIYGNTSLGVGNLRVVYDVDRSILSIDTASYGTPVAKGSYSVMIDTSSDGVSRTYLNSFDGEKMWWNEKIYDIFMDNAVESINSVPAQQFGNVYRNLGGANDPDMINRINDAIENIPVDNTNELQFIDDLYSERSSVIDTYGNMPNVSGRTARWGAVISAMGAMGNVMDVVDLGLTAQKAFQQYKEGDIEGVSDTWGKWLLNTVGSTLFSVGMGALLVGSTISAPVSIGVIMVAGLLGGVLFEDIWDNFLDPLNDKYTDAGNAQPPRDPLAIDLGSLGIHLTSIDNGVHFDLDKNGFAEKTAWIGREDGFLVLDRNGDGVINDGGELFGDQVRLSNGGLSISGFEALKELDKNNDGLINVEDSAWSELRVWIDASQDGRSDGELKTLDDLGITSVGLDVTREENVDTATGTMEAEYAMVTFKDGSQKRISEFWFPVDSSDTTQDTEDGEIIETTGNVPDINVAIANDKTGVLAELYEQFINSNDFVQKRLLLKQILYFVTDSTDIQPGARGGNIDARDLHVIESFMGRDFVGVGGTNPNSNAANILKDLYIVIENIYFNMLNLETEDARYTDLIAVYKQEDGTSLIDLWAIETIINHKIKNGQNVDSLVYSVASYLVNYDNICGKNSYVEFSKYCTELSSEYAIIAEYAKSVNTYLGTAENDYYYGTNISDFVFANEGGDTISGKNGNDILYGGDGNDSVYGDEGADKLYGDIGNDALYGGAGNDILQGGVGNDIIDGGAGNDKLYGEAGDDVYVFTRGYGSNVISDVEGHHTLRFINLNSGDILVNGTGEFDVTITIKGTTDKLVIENFRKGDVYSDYTLEFKDVKMHVTDKNSPFRHIYGSDSNDVLKAVIDDSIMHAFGGDDIMFGSDGNDIIYGNEGNDSITAKSGEDYVFGGEGNDVLEGNAGNDFLYGGSGNDIYVFGRGYGIDIVNDNDGISTIKLSEDITLEDVEINSVGEDIVVCIKNSADKLIVNGVSQNPDLYRFVIGGQTVSVAEHLNNSNEFVSGEENYDYIVNDNKSIIAGGASGDRILGNESDEYVFGDSGNDQLLTYAGDDIVSGGTGDDYINGGAGKDIIDGGTGSDFIDGGSGDDVYIFNPGYGADSVMDSEGFNTIMFGDGFTVEGLKAYRSNWNDLLIKFDGFEDALKIKNYCVNEGARNFTLVFADGTVVEATDKNSPLRTISGTENDEYMSSIYMDGIYQVGNFGNDQLVGSNGEDYLYGQGGDDRITSSGGNDLLDGGSGNDYLYGESGNDTYVYKKGYGIDRIGDAAGTNYIDISGYSLKDIKAYRTNWNDITLTFGDTDDKLVIEGFFVSESNRNFYLTFNGTAKVHACDYNSPLRTIYGTENGDYILAMDDKGVTLLGESGSDSLNGANGVDMLYGGSGDDQLYGNGGNDTLNSGTGNDISYGGAGNDTYIFNAGFGADTIVDNQGINTIKFGTGLSQKKMKAYRTNWNDLTITFNGYEDKLVLQGYFTSKQNRNYAVEFADGTKYTSDDAQNPIKEVYANEYDDWMSAWSDEGIILHGHDGSDNLHGGAGDDILYGDIGNDTLYGNEGNDTLNGGSGNDILAGGNGNDTYVFGVGYGSDVIADKIGINKVVLDNVNSDAVSFDINDKKELVLSINDSSDTMSIQNFETENYTFDFEDGVSGTVNKENAEFVGTVEEEAIQVNAELLTKLYAEDSIATEFVTESAMSSCSISVVATYIADEEMAEQTDVQAMILVENVSAFGQEENVSDAISIADVTEDKVATEQIMIDPQI